MKKAFLILFLTCFICSCTSFKEVVIIDGENIYEESGCIEVEPDYESTTFNITIKSEDGEEKTFFGNSLSGYIVDTKRR